MSDSIAEIDEKAKAKPDGKLHPCRQGKAAHLEEADEYSNGRNHRHERHFKRPVKLRVQVAQNQHAQTDNRKEKERKSLPG